MNETPATVEAWTVVDKDGQLVIEGDWWEGCFHAEEFAHEFARRSNAYPEDPRHPYRVARVTLTLT